MEGNDGLALASSSDEDEGYYNVMYIVQIKKLAIFSPQLREDFVFR